MAPHLSKAELDVVTTMHWAGKGTDDILTSVAKSRKRGGVAAPQLRAIQKALAGDTYRRGKNETRGRKRRWTPAHTHKANQGRVSLYAKAERGIGYSLEGYH